MAKSIQKQMIVAIGILGLVCASWCCFVQTLEAATKEQLKQIADQQKAVEEASQKWSTANQNKRKYYNQYKEYERLADDYFCKMATTNKAIKESDAAAYKEKYKTRRHVLPSITHVKRVFSTIGLLGKRKYYDVQWRRYRGKQDKAQEAYNKARHKANKLAKELAAYRRGLEEAKKKANVTEAKKSRRKEREEDEFFRLPDDTKKTPKKKDQPPDTDTSTIGKDTAKTDEEKDKSSGTQPPPRFVGLGKQNKNKKGQPLKSAGGTTGTTTAQTSGMRPKFVDKADIRASSSAFQADIKQGTGQRDDYRIVSIAAETVPVTHGKQTLQKLKNINAAVIVVEIRGKQHIIDNEEAVSVLIEKGYFYRFPGIGLVATTKYSDFGGYGDGYDEIGKGRDLFGKPIQEGCAGKEPDISCKNYSEKCGGVSSSSSKKVLRDSEGRTRRGSVANWKAIWCANEKKACQAWYANGCKHKRDENFEDKFIEFKASPKDAELYGGAAGPQSR